MNWAILSSLALFITGIFIFWYLKQAQFRQAFYSLIILQCMVMIFAFPLEKSFLYNPNYKSVKTLHRFTGEKMDLYEYKYTTPEVVWEYGEKIPVIDQNGIILQLAEHDKKYVGVLCHNADTDELIKGLNGEYNVRKVSHIDLNTVEPDSEEYKERLARNFLVIFKKTD